MNLIFKAVALLLLLLTTACNETANTPKTEKTQVFKTQIDALEKSKQVEQVLQDSAQQQRQEADKQTQ
ncbi:MAG: hypothetical protein ABL919_10620 [Methylococcales bacterium]|nr:hypothetical protein [Methylococcaceae bacterium]